MKELVVCTKCGWTYFAVTRKYAENEVKEFNAYYDSLTKEHQELYYGGNHSNIANYEYCWCKNKEFKPGCTAPDGSTIGPIIYEAD